LDGLLKMK